MIVGVLGTLRDTLKARTLLAIAASDRLTLLFIHLYRSGFVVSYTVFPTYFYGVGGG